MKLTRVIAATLPAALPLLNILVKKQQVSSWTGTTCRVGPFAVAANLLLPVHLSRPLLMYVMHGSSSEPETKQKPELEAGTAAVEGAKRVKC